MANADTPVFSPWFGQYKSVAPGTAKTTVENAINQGTSSMGMLRRSVARSRLTDVNRPYQTVRIFQQGNELITDFDGNKFPGHADGSPERSKDPRGDPVTVSYRAAGDTLTGKYLGDDGTKEIAFERSPDGNQLTMHVTVTSKKLPQPIHYSIRYQKQ